MKYQFILRENIKISNVMLQFIIFFTRGINSDIYTHTWHGNVSTEQLRNNGKDKKLHLEPTARCNKQLYTVIAHFSVQFVIGSEATINVRR